MKSAKAVNTKNGEPNAMKRWMICAMLLAAVTLSATAAEKAPKNKGGKGPRPAGDGKAVVTGKIEGQILTAGSRRVLLLSSEGKILWQQPSGLTHDTWLLPNGNILFADEATVTEVTPDHQVAWQYKCAPNKGGGAFTCQRLENGNTMVGENSTGKILEVDPAGKVVFELKTEPFSVGNHHNMRMARKLKNGNYLVCHSGAGLVKEYTPKGEVVWQVKMDPVAFSAVRTPQNTTVVGNINRVVEFDAQGKVIWECKVSDIPGVTMRNITGIQLIPNGNIAVGLYAAYDKTTKDGVGLAEITRDKKLVWSYANPTGPDGTMMPIEMLTPEGKPLPGEAMR